jgi:hypothetical protein
MAGGAPDATARAEAPMAFQSVLAGIMLAAEIVLDAAPTLRPTPTGRPAVRTVIDLLRPLAQYLEPPVGRREDPHCFCRDEDYLQTYARKYDGQAPP